MCAELIFDELRARIPDMRAFCRAAGRSFNLSERELEQEGLIALWSAAKKGKRIENVRAFVILSVRNRCIDKTRTRYIGYHGACDIDAIAELPAPRGYSVDWFFSLTDGIEDFRREALYERFVLGLSEKEMAEKHNCAQGTIKSRINRAITKIRENKHAMV